MGQRGMKKGTKLKLAEELHPHHNWTNFTDEQYEFLETISEEYGMTIAKVIRMCVDIVGDMKLSEFERIALSKVWK